MSYYKDFSFGSGDAWLEDTKNPEPSSEEAHAQAAEYWFKGFLDYLRSEGVFLEEDLEGLKEK